MLNPSKTLHIWGFLITFAVGKEKASINTGGLFLKYLSSVTATLDKYFNFLKKTDFGDVFFLYIVFVDVYQYIGTCACAYIC
jgi:hypothetical protein